MSHWADEYITLIEDCEQRCERLSDWESDFVSSLRDQLEAGRALSPKQIDVLDGIWEKVTGRG